MLLFFKNVKLQLLLYKLKVIVAHHQYSTHNQHILENHAVKYFIQYCMTSFVV